MKMWKKNLIVCWFGMFVTGIGMSQIAPVMPLYIKHLGISNTSSIAELSGIAFGITYIISAIFSPIWGNAADKFGRKPMLLLNAVWVYFNVYKKLNLNLIYKSKYLKRLES